jgi:hypothetical protein
MKTGRSAATWAAASLLALACAGGPAEEAEPSLEALMKREVELPPATEIASPDGALHARAAGRLVGGLEKASGGAYFGTFDIGTKAPISCHVFADANDPASSLVELSDNLFAGIARTRKVEKKAVLGVDAAITGADPYLGLDWIAVIDGVTYHIKQKFGNRGDRSVYCLHDEGGYSAAFDRFFSGLLGSLGAPEAPLHREVFFLQIGGNEVGYSTVSVIRDEGGDYRGDTQIAMLVPSAVDQVFASDTYSVEWSRPDGSVISDSSAASDGSSLTRLELSREAGVWKVSGEMQGKPISSSFDAPEVLTSALEESRRMRGVARGDPEELRYWRWVGAASPTKPVEHVMRRSGASSVRAEAGPVRVDTDFDERGATRATMKLGRFEMQMERVYIDGDL